jgi:HAD superfamily hydrolase (TIGR01509 family)
MAPCVVIGGALGHSHGGTSASSSARRAFPTDPATKHLGPDNLLRLRVSPAHAAGNSAEMVAPAVLFDIDGTLIDSNYLHVHAWQRAFSGEGQEVESWRIHRRIGMDGSSLVDDLVPGISDDAAHRLKDLHSRHYRELTGLLRPLPGALRLLDTVAAMGLQVVLATSAPEDELAILRKVLDRDDIVSAVTSSADVETAKPDPGIVAVALRRADVDTDSAVFVGDTVWDIRAAKRAGLPCIAVESGGIDRRLLQAEGAVSVFETPDDLVAHLDETPIGRLAQDLLAR